MRAGFVRDAVPARPLARAVRRSLAPALLTLPALLLVMAIVVLPTGWLFWLSLYGDDGTLGLTNYARLVESEAYARTLRTTFLLSLLVTALVAALGYPLAYMLATMPRRLAGYALILVLLPFWTSTLVRTYAWLVLLQRRGLINSMLVEAGVLSEPLRLVNNMTGTVVGTVHILLPFVVLPLYASMREIGADLMRASASLGASPFAAFRTVFFPLSLPGLAAGCLLAFVLSLGFYITPALLGGGRVIVWSMMIERAVAMNANWGAASALGVVLLLGTGLILWIARRTLGLRAWASR